MIGPAQIRKKALVPWNSGAFLNSCIDAPTIFPLTIRFRTPSGKALLEDFDAVRAWISTLQSHSKEASGKGYEIVWQTIRHRHLGDQRLPRCLRFSNPSDWLAFIQKEKEHDAFREMVARTRDVLPELLSYLCEKPLKALKNAPHWQAILKVCAWFKDHPGPDAYIRQLDISGVDTKFIEAHKAVLMELLPQLVTPAGMDQAVSGLAGHGFERKFGLKYDPPLIRLRLLDPDLAVSGFTDLTVPLDELRDFDPDVKTVFITENKINGLAFPQVRRAMVIFGLGYGVDMLKGLSWLAHKQIYYWGDIDTHGFAMLSQIRSYWPHVRSMLMDTSTLMAHQALWVAESPDKRFSGTLEYLTDAEQSTFDDLKQNRQGACLRLEQERVRFGMLLDWLQRKTEFL